MKSVCFFGIYDSDYARTRVLRRAFEENGYAVTECRVDPRRYKGIRKYAALRKEWNALSQKDFDEVLVCYPGHSVVWLARLLARQPVIFDAFLSLYDSNVFDRKVYSIFHPRAWYDLLLDMSSCLIARKVLLDTNEHIGYFVSTFHIPQDKFIRVFISADESLFYPRHETKRSVGFMVHFHGMFIPLQGLRYVVEAARLLVDLPIQFRIVGSGQEGAMIKSLILSLNLPNVELVGKVPFSDVPEYIADSDVCLGIFGDTDKTLRVIPNKVYEYAAMGKPIITADSPAIKEIFSDGYDVILCRPADGSDLAEKIRDIYEDPRKRLSLGKAARDTFVSRLTARQLGRELLTQLHE